MGPRMRLRLEMCPFVAWATETLALQMAALGASLSTLSMRGAVDGAGIVGALRKCLSKRRGAK